MHGIPQRAKRQSILTSKHVVTQRMTSEQTRKDKHKPHTQHRLEWQSLNTTHAHRERSPQGSNIKQEGQARPLGEKLNQVRESTSSATAPFPTT